MFERYTEPARRVVFFARYEASALGNAWIDGGHLLLGLLREGEGVSGRILARHGLRHHEVEDELRARRAGSERVSTSVDVPLAPDAMRALQHARAEADQARSPHIACEHLLLGVLDEGEGPGATILTARGLSADGVRDELRVEIGAKEADRSRPAFAKLADFLGQLQATGARFQVAAYAGDAVRVEVPLTGEIWVAIFFADGRVAVEVLSAQGIVEDESALARLLERLGGKEG